MNKLNFMLLTQTPVTPIVGLQPGMETFQRVGGGIDMGVFQKMKHIWQSMINKHYGTLQVFVGNRSARKRRDITLVCLKPFRILVNKSLSLRDTFNPMDLGEKISKLLTSFSFGIAPQPAHPFPLDMIQTPLEYGSWPDQSDGSHNRTFTISSNESRIQSLPLKIAKPGIGFLKGLLLHIDMSNNLLIDSIHQIQQAAVLMKIGGIIKHIPDLGIIEVLLRRLLKPIIFNALKGKRAIARNLLEPSNGIAFSDPQLEPMLTAIDPIIALFPDKGVFAL